MGAQSLLNFATISFILQSPPVNPTLLVELFCIISSLSKFTAKLVQLYSYAVKFKAVRVEEG